MPSLLFLFVGTKRKDCNDLQQNISERLRLKTTEEIKEYQKNLDGYGDLFFNRLMNGCLLCFCLANLLTLGIAQINSALLSFTRNFIGVGFCFELLLQWI